MLDGATRWLLRSLAPPATTSSPDRWSPCETRHQLRKKKVRGTTLPPLLLAGRPPHGPNCSRPDFAVNVSLHPPSKCLSAAPHRHSILARFERDPATATGMGQYTLLRRHGFADTACSTPLQRRSATGLVRWGPGRKAGGQASRAPGASEPFVCCRIGSHVLSCFPTAAGPLPSLPPPRLASPLSSMPERSQQQSRFSSQHIRFRFRMLGTTYLLASHAYVAVFLRVGALQFA
ncbi:hypothetical protein BS50DRAFT_149952 [Corynespora cassiicola Philippines]|uniref:Uncharacterized protein n=1 Tax=Corynespora cassiicola Philippines TaxID=1448308 RepID=A0A2T2N7I5_CORCC|nr:hypothetical protein BS50DRAFT_149952 [Corynespora cassiicola Philippines]